MVANSSTLLLLAASAGSLAALSSLSSKLGLPVLLVVLSNVSSLVVYTASLRYGPALRATATSIATNLVVSSIMARVFLDEQTTWRGALGIALTASGAILVQTERKGKTP